MAVPGFPERLYETIDEVENPERYEDGGYHPVTLGGRLADGRYAVVHKLGYGSYSTVWLSRDTRTRRLVAVKIAVASAAEESRARRESEIRRQLGLAAASHPWGKYVHKLLDTFVETGPNGAHQCLVSEPAGGSLADSKSSGYISLFPLQVSRAICAQMIRAAAFLHSQGIVHGDLHLGNILIASLGEAARAPVRIPVKRRDGAPLAAGVPPYVVWPGIFCPPSHKMPLAEAHIVLSDFGEAWSPSSEDRFKIQTARNYRAPDAVLDPQRRPLGAASDIWSLGLALFAVYATGDLLQAWASPDGIVFEAIQALGRPPQALWDAWAARSTFYDDAGTPKMRGGAPYALRESVLDVRLDREDAVADFPDDPPFGDDEMQDVLDMLLSMLQWAADDRVTASELVTGAWMQKWGLPALAKMGEPQRVS